MSLGPGLLWALAAAILVPGISSRAAAGELEPQDLTDAVVRAATRAITAELYERKDPDRFWDPPSWDPDRDGQSAQAGGYTPLVVLALLHAGESYQDPRLRDAITHLQQVELTGTYAIAVRAHVWALLPERFSDRLAGDTRWLLEAFKPAFLTERPIEWIDAYAANAPDVAADDEAADPGMLERLRNLGYVDP